MSKLLKEKLKIYKEIQRTSEVFTSEFTLASSAITALEWVFEVNNDNK